MLLQTTQLLPLPPSPGQVNDHTSGLKACCLLFVKLYRSKLCRAPFDLAQCRLVLHSSRGRGQGIMTRSVPQACPGGGGGGGDGGGTGAAGPLRMSHAFKPHVCLGNAAEWERQQAQQQQQQESAQLMQEGSGCSEDTAWLAALDPGCVPQSVLDAARQLGPRGSTLLQCYVELHQDRWGLGRIAGVERMGGRAGEDGFLPDWMLEWRATINVCWDEHLCS